MSDGSALLPSDVARILEDLRVLDRLGPAQIARVLPELERARARLWLSMLTSHPAPPEAPAEPAQQLLTVKEAAKYLRFSRGHTYELVRSGQLRGIRVGRTIRITREALAEWRIAHEGDRLDGNHQSSGESLLHDDLHLNADGRHPLPGRTRRRRQPPSMMRGC
jgi:excisionase family DNA binding protein